MYTKFIPYILLCFFMSLFTTACDIEDIVDENLPSSESDESGNDDDEMAENNEDEGEYEESSYELDITQSALLSLPEGQSEGYFQVLLISDVEGEIYIKEHERKDKRTILDSRSMRDTYVGCSDRFRVEQGDVLEVIVKYTKEEDEEVFVMPFVKQISAYGPEEDVCRGEDVDMVFDLILGHAQHEDEACEELADEGWEQLGY